MSFKHKGVIVTLSNYLQVFGDCTPDILDEIRSAILDDTPISGVLKVCGEDNYKLGQLRLAIREYVPKEFINPRLSGECIKLIRKLYKEKFDLSVVRQYIPYRGIPTIENDNLALILRAVLNGADIRKVDFNIVPNDNIKIICEGLIKGYPMWLCVSKDKYISNAIIKQLMKGMQLNIDIHPFVDGNWSESQIVYILSNANKIDIGLLLKHVNYRFSVDQISEIIYLACRNLDFVPLCMKEKDGTPAFNSYQMNVLGKCIEAELFLDDVYNPSISDMDMLEIYDNLLEQKKREEGKKLKVTLPKNAT